MVKSEYMTNQVVKVKHKRALGPWMLTALVAGNMVGSGIYYLPTELASFGSISLLAWVFTACGLYAGSGIRKAGHGYA